MAKPQDPLSKIMIDDGIIFLQGTNYKKVMRFLSRFSIHESGKGHNYDVTIHELQAEKSYLLKFSRNTPLDALTTIVWLLQSDHEEKKLKVIAYTNCNKYGIPADAMLCFNEAIDDSDIIAVDRQGKVYVIDYDDEQFNYTSTDKTSIYTSCPSGKGIINDTFSITDSHPTLHTRLKSLVRNISTGWFCNILFWIIFVLAIIAERLSIWIDLPEFITDHLPFFMIACAVIIVISNLLYQHEVIRISPLQLFIIVAAPIILCIFANYYITTHQCNREAIIVNKDDDENGTWVLWTYLDDNSHFGIHDETTNHQFSILDTCVVDWRRGLLGWPVVRSIKKKDATISVTASVMTQNAF